MVTFSLVLSYIAPLVASRSNDELPLRYEENTLEINGEELAAFASQFDHVATLVGEQALAHNEKVDDILLNDTLSYEMKNKYLAGLGVYQIDLEKTVEYAASVPGDVQLSKPIICYDTATKEYIICGTGKWTKQTYEAPYSFSIVLAYIPTVGTKMNIGGPDAVGISLTNTSGSSTGLAINSGYGYFFNGQGTEKSTTLTTKNDK